MSENFVTVDKKEYEKLLEKRQFLQCLQGAGVDNWEGYDIAQDEFEKRQEEKDEQDK